MKTTKLLTEIQTFLKSKKIIHSFLHDPNERGNFDTIDFETPNYGGSLCHNEEGVIGIFTTLHFNGGELGTELSPKYLESREFDLNFNTIEEFKEFINHMLNLSEFLKNLGGKYV